MEQHLSDKEKQKIRNKNFPDNTHLLVMDKRLGGKLYACICDLEEQPLYHMTDRSSEKLTEISIYDASDEEAVLIKEVPIKPKSREKHPILPYRFQISFFGKYAGFIQLDALSLTVELEGFSDNWSIAYSDRRSLGYAYKYTVYEQNREAAHFRSKVLHQSPFYLLDYAKEEDRLFLITLFIIHSVYTNKKPQRDIKKENRLARSKGLFGL